VAVHPSDENDVHELFLMCDDVHALIARSPSRVPDRPPRQTPFPVLTLPHFPPLGRGGAWRSVTPCGSWPRHGASSRR
jgi:hypothetical protein